MPPEAIANKMQDPQWCLRQAESVGADFHDLIRELFSHRVLDNLRAAQGVIDDRVEEKVRSPPFLHVLHHTTIYEERS